MESDDSKKCPFVEDIKYRDQPRSVPTGGAAVFGATMLVLFGITLGRGAFLVADEQGRTVPPPGMGCATPAVTKAEFDQRREDLADEDAARAGSKSPEQR